MFIISCGLVLRLYKRTMRCSSYVYVSFQYIQFFHANVCMHPHISNWIFVNVGIGTKVIISSLGILRVLLSSSRYRLPQIICLRICKAAHIAPFTFILFRSYKLCMLCYSLIVLEILKAFVIRVKHEQKI